MGAAITVADFAIVRAGRCAIDALAGAQAGIGATAATIGLVAA
jgi:hypothetical protein